jgi:O-antigen/teichoic acid export membrane protein
LDYRIRVRVEFLEVGAMFIWSVALAALGFGAWSLATALVVKSIVGAIAVIWMTPTGFIAPRFAIAPVRGLLAFGARFQALSMFQMVTSVALTAGIAGVGGLAALGFWSLTQRILQLPMMLFEVIWSLSVPTFARLLHGGEDVGEMVGRSLSVISVVAGVVLATLAGCGAALIPIVFGDTWSDAALILPGACMALVISGPTNIALMGFLYAHGDAVTPLRGSVAHSLVRIPASLIGLHYFGVAGLGVAWFLAQAIELPIVVPPASRAAGTPLGRALVAPAIACALAAAGGWAIIDVMGTGVQTLLVSGFATPAAFIVLMAILDFAALRTATVTIRRVTTLGRARLMGGESTRPQSAAP